MKQYKKGRGPGLQLFICNRKCAFCSLGTRCGKKCKYTSSARYAKKDRFGKPIKYKRVNRFTLYSMYCDGQRRFADLVNAISLVHHHGNHFIGQRRLTEEIIRI